MNHFNLLSFDKKLYWLLVFVCISMYICFKCIAIKVPIRPILNQLDYVLRGLVENKIEDKFYFRNHNFHQENC